MTKRQTKFVLLTCLFVTGIATGILLERTKTTTCKQYTKWQDDVCIYHNLLLNGGEGALVGCQSRTCLDDGKTEIRRLTTP